MPPIPTSGPLPRLVVYYQTLHDPSGKSISILPLLTQPGIAVTHLILAALHINADPLKLTLNDHSPSHPRHETVWAELRVLQAAGIKVMGLLGGAAQGSYQRLDGSETDFERYYIPLRDLIRDRGLDGIDLDVEEEMTLEGIIRLIDRLRADFGKDFLISMAPVAMAMLDFTKNMSGFDYEALEVMRGKDIAWYNAQFYCGWGDCSNPLMYDLMIRKGWPPEKLVMGTLTNPGNGPGYVPWNPLSAVLTILKGRHGGKFGGVAGWEYFNSLPGGKGRPWEWARQMTGLLRGHILEARKEDESAATRRVLEEVDPDDPSAKAAPVPSQFEYFSDGVEED
jgi:hypothetical protein